MPKLSVIVPTYNRAALLPKTLQSVFDQTFTDYEIIVVDDGSTDRTQEVIAKLRKSRPAQGERIRYLFQRNQGKSVALNRGLSEARGEWIAFQDSDDLWLPNKIEEQFRALRQYAPQSQACFTDARFINDPSIQGTAFEHAGQRYRGGTGLLGSPVEIIGKFWIYIQTLLLHSRVAAKVGEFDPRFWVAEDEDYIFRLSLYTRLCCVNSPLTLINRNPEHSQRLTALALRREYEVLQIRQLQYKKWLNLSVGFGADIQRALRHRLCGAYSEQANWLLANRRYREAWRAARMGVQTQCRPGIVGKLCLTGVAPAFARQIVVRRSRNGHKPRVPAVSLFPDTAEGAEPSACKRAG